MNGVIVRQGCEIGDVRHASFDGDQIRFTTSASVAFSQYEVVLPGRAPIAVLVVAIARDGRGPWGELAPGRTRVAGIPASTRVAPGRRAA